MNKEQTLEFLSKAADLHASDIFIIAGRPLSIKTDGRLSTYGDRLMPEQTSEIQISLCMIFVFLCKIF